MAKPKPKSAKPTHEEFVFQVRDASVSYGFSLPYSKRERDAFWEHQDVTLVADCLYPDRFKGREVTVRLLGGRDQMDMKARTSGDWEPKGVGWMDAGQSRFEITLSLPLDASWQIGSGIAAGTITSLLTNGPTLYRGKTTLTSFTFNGPSFDPLEYLGEA